MLIVLFYYVKSGMITVLFLFDSIVTGWKLMVLTSRGEIYFLKEELRSCDEIIDKGDCSNEVVYKRTKILNKIHQMTSIEAGEMGRKGVLARLFDNSFRRKARSGIEEMQLNSLAEISRMTTLVPCEDRYVWTLESDGVFSVASIRKGFDGN
ncbi:hypothetical protein Tco_1280305 [Tanacetum coccineum]